MLSSTAKKALDFYGGLELWHNSKFIEAEVSVKGLLFTIKRRPFMKRANIKMKIGEVFSRITPIGKNSNIVGVLDGPDVRLEDMSGGIIETRKNARQYFPYKRRLFYWDDLDMSYFANYALWNYFNFPSLLLNESILWNEKAEGKLEATFPDSIPTHSKIQEFRIDVESGRLMQHNYTAMVVSKLANASNIVAKHSEANGLFYPSKRIITPQNSTGGATSWPVLVDIEVHKFKLTNEEIIGD